MKTYDSPHKAPKCKVNLTPRLANTALAAHTAHTAHEVGNESSRSSLYSIPSLEWDGRCKSDFGLRSRSLPRYKTSKLFRTQSHSGFINAYMKDPEPMHYHLPRCRSCGATNLSYAFELTKDEKHKKSKYHTSIYFSVDNISQKCSEDAEGNATYVKVQEKFVPVFKVQKKDTEFVESQEFNEDNYIGDIGNSFSSENQTIIEKSDAVDQTVVVSEKNAEMCIKSPAKEIIKDYTEDLVATDLINDVNKTLESIEGEYHSFTDLEDSYESPVKELVEKDIRDYSVPIDFYCDDFKTSDDANKSPLKVKNILEPILEESKSSYGDDSNLSQNEKKEELIQNIVDDVVNTAVLAGQLKLEIATNTVNKVTTESLVAECTKLESYLVNEKGSDVIANDLESSTINTIETAIDVYENALSEQDIDCLYENVFDILSTESDVNIVKRQNSLASTLSSNDRNSFDSTAEFEKYEAVSEVLSAILNRIDVVDLVINVKVPIFNINEDITADGAGETFSIAKLIEDIEQGVCLNETVLTEGSGTDIGLANKVTEGILYYIFDRAMYINHEKQKGSKKSFKRVITVADLEDILFTAKPIWMEAEDHEEIDVEEKHSEEQEFYDIKDFFNANCLTKAPEQNTSIITQQVEDRSTDKVVDCKETDRKIKTIYSVIVSEKTSPKVTQSNRDNDHLEHYENAADEVGTGSNIVCNIDNQGKTNYCNQIEVGQEFVPNHTYAIDKLAIDETISTNNNLNVDTNITEDISVPITNDISRAADIENFLNETFVESSDMNNAFHEYFSQSEDPTMSSHTEELFATPDVDLTTETKENMSLEPVAFTVGNITDASQEDYHSTANDEFRDISDRTEEFASFSAQSPDQNIEEYLSPIKEPSFPNEDVFLPEYRDISHKSAVQVSDSDSSRKRKNALSQSSSPNRKTVKTFELTESPIKRVPKDSPLEKLPRRRVESETASSFSRKANVLAMSQTEHSGGVKYWLSFDEHLKVESEKHIVRTGKSIDDTLPSFISIDIDDDGKSYEKATKNNNKRTSVLMNEYSDNEVSFPSAGSSSIEYASREASDPGLDDSESRSPRQRLLYELHSRPTARLYSSWPPFEETLFYRIISKFRMSESFDPNDLDDPNFDSNSYDAK